MRYRFIYSNELVKTRKSFIASVRLMRYPLLIRNTLFFLSYQRPGEMCSIRDDDKIFWMISCKRFGLIECKAAIISGMWGSVILIKLGNRSYMKPNETRLRQISGKCKHTVGELSGNYRLIWAFKMSNWMFMNRLSWFARVWRKEVINNSDFIRCGAVKTQSKLSKPSRKAPHISP